MRATRRSPARPRRRLVQAALQRLRTGGYTYTLEPGVYGDDTADEFWFDRKEGFCEHIASAFVVLMRALDIPARIVTGYQGGELNGVDGFWMLRQSDAHAWAEVWQEGAGWVRVDPTGAISPGRIGQFQRLRAAAGRVRRRHRRDEPRRSSQNLRAAWEAREQRLEPVGAQLHAEPAARPAQEPRLRGAELEDLSYVLLALMVAASLAGAAWTLWERSQHDPWLRLLGQARARLKQAGIERARRDAAAPDGRAAGTSASAPARRPARDWLLQARGAALRRARRARRWRRCAREFRRLAWPALKPHVSPRLRAAAQSADATPSPRPSRRRCRCDRAPAGASPQPKPRRANGRNGPCAAARPMPRAKTRCSSPTTWPQRRDLDREWVRATIGSARMLPIVPRLMLPAPSGHAEELARLPQPLHRPGPHRRPACASGGQRRHAGARRSGVRRAGRNHRRHHRRGNHLRPQHGQLPRDRCAGHAGLRLSRRAIRARPSAAAFFRGELEKFLSTAKPHRAKTR